MERDFYAELAADYDRMIRWERRLSVERPQFDALVRRFHVQTVLDASCGSGHHLVLLASLGLDVEGADASPAMVELAKETTRAAGLAFDDKIHCTTWQQLASSVPRTFDAVLCIGNSLPYVMNPGLMRESVRGLWSRVNPAGILIIQYKNFGKLVASRERFLPLSWVNKPNETVAVRLYDYHADHIGFNVILLDRIGEEWTLRHHETTLHPYAPEEVAAAIRNEGAEVSLHGSLGLEPFNPEESGDVVLLAKRPK